MGTQNFKAFNMLNLLSLSLLLGLFSACQNDNLCDNQGNPCIKNCPENETGLCVTDTMCRCVPFLGGDESGTEAGTEAGTEGGSMAGNTGGHSGPSNCEPPSIGDLIINEAMIDAEGDENTYEFVELANLSERAIDLSGIKLSYKGSEKVNFLSGCMAPKSLVAMFASEDEWQWSSPASNINMTKSAFRFSNSSDFSFTLSKQDGEELSRFEGEQTLIDEGISINRSPDLSGDSFMQHSDLSHLSNSPALCANGARYEDECIGDVPAGNMAGDEAGSMAGSIAGDEAGSIAGSEAGSMAGTEAGSMAGTEIEPPCDLAMSGELIINEVMIDPSGDETRDEYIELVNLSDHSVYLGGIIFKYKERNQVIFNGGCMPAKSIAVLYDDESLWSWSMAVEGLSYEKLSFQFANSNDFEFSLSRDDLVIDSMSGGSELIQSGVSINRNPDFSTEPVSVDLHTSLNSDLQSSPGFCANGGDFSSDCFVEVTGGEAMGGEAMGGEAMGGEAMGGEAMGGEAMGGEAMGGATMGGEAMGGEAMGGEAMGGEAMGGEAMGGEAMGGEAMGGEAMGGVAMGGEAMGGEAMGGETMGGEAMGGEAMGGATMGGETMGGEAMGGEAMGGATMGGETMGGEAMGGEAMGGATMGGETMGGEAMGGEVPPNCVTPTVGQLVINEVLANPEGNESSDRSEWIEIVNVSDQFVEMGTVSLWKGGQEEITFAQGCMAPNSALALFNQAEVSAWQWSSPPTGVLATESTGSFGITNTTDILLEIKNEAEVINAFSASSMLIQSGISINRSPDGSPDGSLVLHNTLSEMMSAFSTGLCVNGARFEASCMIE